MRMYTILKSDLMILSQLGETFTELGFGLLLAAAYMYIRKSEDLTHI